MSVRETLELDLRQALASVSQLDRAFRESTARFETGINRATSKLSTTVQVGGISQATEGLNGLASATTRTANAMEQGQGSALGYSRLLGQVGFAATAAGAALTGLLVAGVAAAAKLEDAFAPLGTLLGANTRQFDQLTGALEEMLGNVPQSAEELGASAYTILSAGITGTTNVIKTLDASRKLSEAGLGDLAQATDLVTSAINSFSTEGLTANKAAQILFGTITLGKTTTAGLAEGFGQIAPLAAAAGVRFKELLAATAALTATGQSASIAYTGLRGVITGILRPSADAAATAKQLGIDFSLAALKAQGFEKFLAGVVTAAKGNTQALVNLFGSVEGLNAVLALTGPQAAKFADNLRGIDDAGKNLSARAREIEGTFSNTMKVLGNQVTLALNSAFKPLLPVLKDIAGGLGNITERFGELPSPVRLGAIGVTALTGALFTAVGLLGIIGPKILIAQGLLRSFGDTASRAAGTQTRMDAATTALANNLGNIAKATVGLSAFFAIGPQLEGLTGDFTTAGLAAGALAGSLFGLPGIAVGATLGAIAGATGLLGDQAEATRKKVEGLGKELEAFGARKAAKEFVDEFGNGLATLAADLETAGRTVDRTGQDIDRSTAAIDGARRRVADFDEAFRNLSRSNPVAAQRVVDGLVGMGAASGLTTAELEKLQRQVDRGEKSFQRHAANTDAARTAIQQLTPAIGAATASLEEQIAATEKAKKFHDDYVASLLKGLPTILSVFDEASKGVEGWGEAGVQSSEELLKAFENQLVGIERWGQNLERLVSLGANHLVAIFAQKGPQATGALLQALIDGDPAIIGQLEATATRGGEVISGLAARIGGPIADQLYGSFFGAGAAAGDGLVGGINSKTIDALGAAGALADATALALNAGLGISSPSKVFMEAGVLAAQGLALGLEQGAEKFVDRAGRRLALRTVTSFSSPGGETFAPHITVQAPIPNPAAVGLETVRMLRRHEALRGR